MSVEFAKGADLTEFSVSTIIKGFMFKLLSTKTSLTKSTSSQE